VQSIMAGEADAICSAGYGERSAERVNSRNGYRPRASRNDVCDGQK
jgi:transposase-like protein